MIVEVWDANALELAPFRRTDAQLRSLQHPEEALFMAESGKVVLHALDAGLTPVAFMMERKHITGQAAEALARCDDSVPVYTGPDELLGDILGCMPDRCIRCLMKRPPERTAAEVCQGARRIAVLESVTDATNIGALIRSAAALGMEAVLLTPSCCDPLHRRAVRVSMGTVFQVPWAYLPSADVAGELKALGFASAALALTKRSVPVDDARLAAEERLALVLGAEGNGLRQETIRGCDYTVLIPMAHGVDSLNVAAAGAVAFWQLGRR